MESKQIKPNTIGTFQGSIISPILSNIYLHQLDEAVERMMERFNTSAKTSRVEVEHNKMWVFEENPERKLRKEGRTEEANTMRNRRMETPHSNFQDDKYKKMTYVRYADD